MQTSKDSENDLQGAISAVDNINRLAWRYFVDQLPFEGKDILQQVCMCFMYEKAPHIVVSAAPAVKEVPYKPLIL